MSIQFSGISSGIPVNDIITQLMAIERQPITQMETRKKTFQDKQSRADEVSSKANSLLAKIRTITDDTFSNPDIFARKTSTSSNDSFATATVTKEAAAQTITLKIHQLATATKASSTTPVGQVMTGATLLSDIGGTAGSLSIYVNGVATQINVAAGDSISSVLTQIDGVAGVTGATVNAQGKIEITTADPDVLQLGGTGDTSNLFQLTGLNTGVLDIPMVGTRRVTSSVPTSLINLGGQVENNADVKLNTAVAAGSTFTIGSASFTTTGKTLQELMTEVNNNTGAGVYMSYNRANNGIQIISKETGSNYVSMADTAGNFLAAIGVLGPTAQTLGNDAQVEINGGMYFSESNTVTETVHGMTGVNLNLLQADAGATEVTIQVKKDTEPLKTAINDFISKYNELSSYIDLQTNAEQKGLLAGDNAIIGFRRILRQMVTDSVPGLTSYNSMPLVGISTGAAGTGTGVASNTLVFDSTKLETALAQDPAQVEELFNGTNGIMTKLEAYLNTQINDSNGIFMARKESTDDTIERIDDNIAAAERRLESREKLLRQQFTAMETMISRYKAQGTAVSGLAAKLGQTSS